MLSSGTLAEIEDAAQEVILFGLPGGVCPGAAPRAWVFDEGSLHQDRIAPTMRGTHRVMMYPGGRGTLVFIRADYRVVYLGAGAQEELKATADERLAQRYDATLRVRCFGQTHELFGVGVLGVVGQAPLVRGGIRLMLVQVGLDHFELHLTTRTGECMPVGEYRGADLDRGDLGEIQLVGPLQQGAHRTDDMSAPPRRSSPLQHTGQRRGGYRPPTPPSDPREPTPPSDIDVQRLANCLDWKQVPTSGSGKSEISNFYAAFRELVVQGFGNLLLWAKEWRHLIESRTPVRFGDCCDRTLTRALALFLKVTGLGKKEGRRFRVFFGDLQRGGEAVWATIRERFPPLAEQPETMRPAPQATPANTAAASGAAPTVAPTSELPAVSANTTPIVAPSPSPEVSASTPTKTLEPPALPSAGPGSPGVNNVNADPWLSEVTALYQGELATGSREADVEMDTGGHEPTGDHWTPYYDRSWTRDAPSQFPGKARGPPLKR